MKTLLDETGGLRYHTEEVRGIRLVEESMLEGKHTRGEGQDLRRSWGLVLKILFFQSVELKTWDS